MRLELPDGMRSGEPRSTKLEGGDGRVQIKLGSNRYGSTGFPKAVEKLR